MTLMSRCSDEASTSENDTGTTVLPDIGAGDGGSNDTGMAADSGGADAGGEDAPDSGDAGDSGDQTDGGGRDTGSQDAGGGTDASHPDAGRDGGTRDGGRDAGGDAGTDHLYKGSGDPYDAGPLTIKTINVTSGQSGAPKAMQIHHPQEAGEYAVVAFQHGFLVSGTWYSDMLKHVASHGFIVVAPQMYNADSNPIGKPKTPEEAADGVLVYDWLPANLGALTGVTPRMDHFGLAGHSRGGKVIWTVLKGDSSRAKAVAGVDPVDGTGGPMGGEERIISGPFNFPFPSYALGTGKGPTGLQPCAPAGDNHVQFYGASASPAWHVVATDYGHMDMLNANNSCGLTCSVCAAGQNKPNMVKLTGGMLAAFFRGSLQGDTAAFDWLTDVGKAPATITAESK